MGTLETIDTSSANTDQFYCWGPSLPDRSDIKPFELEWLKGCNFESRFIRTFNIANVEATNYYKYLNIWMLLYWDYNNMCQHRLDWQQLQDWHEKISLGQFFRTENNTSETEDLCELVFDVLETKKISWQEASKIAFLAFARAEERRNIFAEKEAVIAAAWEELD